MKASIVINNHNYDRFLRDAIESALAQTWRDLEVVVVDDGSTDRSRDIIASLGSRVRPVFKENGGQASALNAGFNASSGDVVFFLDSDDLLVPHAVEKVMPVFTNPEIVKAHWPLRTVDQDGRPTGRLFPNIPLPQGDLRELVLQGGPTSTASAPTSGNAWHRRFLQNVMPIPESAQYYKRCADEYLYTLAPVFGLVAALSEPLGDYRMHGANIYASRSAKEKLELELAGHEEQCAALAQTLARHGVTADLSAWRAHSWFHRLHAAVRDIHESIPAGESFLLVDGDTWSAAELFPHHTPCPFFEQDGVSWGPPPDDAAAIRTLHKAQHAGFHFLVLAWPAFWWIESYPGLFEHLAAQSRTRLKNDRVVIFELRPPSTTELEERTPVESRTSAPLVSIVVNNFNYARFVGSAIESALGQTYPNKEIIVVDDGSTDDSRAVLGRYRGRIQPLFQANGGQGAAYNSGFKLSRGDWICYLDADDLLHPTAVEELIPLTRQPDVVKLQWRLHTIDAEGKKHGPIIPRDLLPQGDLRSRVTAEGPLYDWNFTPPGSGNLWARSFLKKVFPMPEPPYRNGADVYLITLAPVYGRILTAPRPLGSYRMHGNNNYSGRELSDERILNYLQRFDTNCQTLQHHLRLQGLPADPESWRNRNFNHLWPRRLLSARNHIRRLIPLGGQYILVDDNEWGNGEPVAGRHAIPFLERDGEYWGQPADDDAAVAELERLHHLGADYVVVWWTASWWLDHYPQWHHYLRSHYSCVLEDECVTIFQLTPDPAPESASRHGKGSPNHLQTS